MKVQIKRLAGRNHLLLMAGALCGVAGAVQLVSAGQEIKKHTELVCPKDGIALTVAEKTGTGGVGSGIGMQLLKAVAAKSGKLPPEEQPDADHDYNEDSTKSSDLAARSLCHLNLRDRVAVIGEDGGRVLVQVRNKSYGGRQAYPSIAPLISDGVLGFSDAGITPSCLNKTKLWINHDVFLSLKALPVPPDPVKLRKQQADDDKAALRRATGAN